MDNLEFLESNEEPEAIVEQPVEQVEEPAAPEPEAERPRDENGRFAPKDKGEPIMVPLAALHETRDELKALKAQLATVAPQPEPEPLPDVFEDQQGFVSTIQQQVQAAVYAERLNFSKSFAAQKYGEDTVKQALEWGQAKCGSDPYFNATVMNNPDPVGFAVEQFQREQIASQVDLSEFEKFKAWQAAQAQAQPTPAPTNPTPPPRSLATAPSSGGVQHEPVGPGQAFDSLFK